MKAKVSNELWQILSSRSATRDLLEFAVSPGSSSPSAKKVIRVNEKHRYSVRLGESGQARGGNKN